MRKIEENLRTNPALKADLEAFLKRAASEAAADKVASAKLRSDVDVLGRHLDADKLLRQLRDAHHVDKSDELQAVVERALADLPEESLDDAALARLKTRHSALHLVKLVAGLKGPLSAATEIALQSTFEKVITQPIEVEQGKAR
jgi:hypothetical protein